MKPATRQWVLWLAILVGAIGVAVSGYRAIRRKPAPPADLSRGGVEITYDVDVARSLDERFAAALDALVAELRKEGVAVGRIAPAPRSATLGVPGADETRLRAAVAKGWLTASPLSPAGDLQVRMPEEMARRLEDAAMQQAARVAHDRLEKLGWCVPTVKQVGTRLVVGIPRVEPARLEQMKRILLRRGRFELREIDPGELLRGFAGALPAGGPVSLREDRWFSSATGKEERALALEARDPAELEKARATLAPPGGLEALIEPHDDDVAGKVARLYLVRRDAEVTGEAVRAARVVVDTDSRPPAVEIELDEGGAARFRDLTARIVGHKLAIVVDGSIQSAPVVETPIPGGKLLLTLASIDRTREQLLEEAQDLVGALQGGALPAPLTMASERVIAPAK